MYACTANALRALAVVCGLALAVPAQATPQTLDADQMRSLAIAAVGAGRPEAALALADALLARDDADTTARLVRARALRDTGQLGDARTAARRAWAAAETPEDRFAAATARAQVLSSSGNRTMAQFWLRRAAQIAPSDMHRAVAEQDYAYVRSRNRLSFWLDLGVAPVSNINNGSRRDTGTFELPVFGVLDMQLTGAAQALSGTEYAAGLALRYRLDAAATPQTRTDLQLDLRHRDYRLSDEAQQRAPGVEGSDFAYSSVQATLVRRGHAAGPRWPFTLSAGLGRSWYGGDPYTRFADLGGEARHILPGGRQALSLRAGLRDQTALSGRTTDSRSLRAGLGWQGLLPGAHSLALNLSVQDSRSDAASLDYTARTLEARLAAARPLWGVAFDLSLSAGTRDFDRGPVAGQGRRDVETSATLGATVTTLDLYGFVPRVSLEARRTDSDFGQYDSDEFGVRVGLRSAF